MKIVIDSQEPEIWDKRFAKEGFEVERKKLDIGDYYNPETNVLVERKSWGDFCSSIITGHLQKQAIQMQENYEHSYLFITGCMVNHCRFGKKFTTKNYITGFLAHLRHYKNITIIPCEQETWMPLIIKKIVEKNKEPEVNIKNTELLRNKVDTDIMRIRTLIIFDRVGIKRAEKLLEKEEVSKEVESFLEKMKELGVWRT